MKILSTNTYLLLIDTEAGIYQGDTIVRISNNEISEANDEWSGEKHDDWKKGIGYYPLTKEAKELDLHLLPNPFIGIKKLAEDRFYDKLKESPYKENPGLVYYFIEGYKAAQSHSKQFTLEDVKKAIEMARETYLEADPEGKNEEWIGYTEEQIIQSLSTQQLPKEFIPESEFVGSLVKGSLKLKIVTNSECKQELVGEYKW